MAKALPGGAAAARRRPGRSSAGLRQPEPAATDRAAFARELDAALAALASGAVPESTEKRISALEELIELRNAGVLTQAEYQAERRRLLG